MSGEERLSGLVAFLGEAARLKDTLRSGFTNEGRSESVADHTWRLCLLAMLIARDRPEIDQLKLLQLCIVHDLGEALSGDVPAIRQSADDDKASRERVDLNTLCAALGEDQRAYIMSLHDEYEAAQTPEAILAKGLDKLETIFQHAIGANPPDFDYGFNLSYGTAATGRDPMLQALRRLADQATQRRMVSTDQSI
ncbi:MAG: HD domain-containing protein [Ahrensia sp.]|nr:HD domain-containing protein [Ahrensia sp.]